MRYAIYFTPSHDDPLTRAAIAWLGRDAFGGAASPVRGAGRFSADEIDFHTASARRYGFHATIKAPFRIAQGETADALSSALDAYCASIRAVTIDRLIIGSIDGFFALVPQASSSALQAFAGDVVRTFDRFRAPLSEAEIERRNPDRLSASEFSNLTRWGYPYVFDDFRFHMTLTGRVDNDESADLRAAIVTHFGTLIDRPLVLDGLGLFVEPEPGAPFLVHSYHRIGVSADGPV